MSEGKGMEDWDNSDLIVQDIFVKNHFCESCTIFSEHKFLVFNWFSMLSENYMLKELLFQPPFQEGQFQILVGLLRILHEPWKKRM